MVDKQGEISQEDIEIPKLRNLLQLMPLINKKLTLYLIDFLGRVSENGKSNKMTVSNLATVFGPLLFRSQDTTDLASESSSVNNLVEMLVNYRVKLNVQ